MINVRWFLIPLCVLCSLVIMRIALTQQEIFTVDPVVLERNDKVSLHDKKYAELEEDLIHLYEEALQLQIEKLTELAQAQKACIESFKKVLINKPQMSRERLKKEIERIQKVMKSLENVTFF